MQRKRNIQLLISLVVLLSVTVAFVVFDNTSDLSVDKSMFRQADLSVIDHVRIQQGPDDLNVSYDGVRWMANGELADRNMVEVLFATLQQAQPKRAVGASIADSVAQEMELHGIRVELYDGEIAKESFLVMGSGNKGQTYFKKVGQGTPYIMNIPGYRVYVAGIFELDLNGWKDKIVFGLNWRNFKGLRADFPGNPENNFDVGMGDQNYFSITGVQAVDTTRLNDFLDAVSYLTVDQYVDSSGIFETEAPQMTISVMDVSGKNFTLEIFAIRDGAGRQFTMVQERQPAWIDARKLEAVIKEKSWFLARD